MSPEKTAEQKFADWSPNAFLKWVLIKNQKEVSVKADDACFPSGCYISPSTKKHKVIIVGVKQDDGAIYYGHAKRLKLTERELDGTYALLHADQKQELISLNIWDNKVIIVGEEYVGENNPLMKKLEEFKKRLSNIDICKDY